MTLPRTSASHRPRARLLTAGCVCLLVAAGEFASSAETPQKLVAAARTQTQSAVRYDGAYATIAYPLGDVPADRGVCTDVVIRAYRAAAGVDLQVLVHEDMTRDFAAYPPLWGLRKPDRNIDHRRVPNLQTFFERAGAGLPVSTAADAYQPGDVVSWMLPGNRPHIGIVSDAWVDGTRRRKIIHNIGAGPVEDDILFAFEITGHYRYFQD